MERRFVTGCPGTDGRRNGMPAGLILAAVLFGVTPGAVPRAARAQDPPAFRAMSQALDGGAECLIGKVRAPGGTRAHDAASKSSAATAGFDATFYGLDLRMHRLPSAALTGRVRVEGRVTTPSLVRLDLDLNDAMIVSAVRTPSGQSLVFSQAQDVLSITLPSVAPYGALVALDIDYAGTPPRSGFGSFGAGTRSNGDPYVWSLSEPYGAREWWPCKDHPADKADSVVVSMTLPDPMRLGSNGLLMEETANGDGTTTYTWRHRYPISSYLVSVAAGVYDVTLQEYVRPDSLAAVYGNLALPLVHYAYRGTGAYEGSADGTVLTQGWKRVVDMLPIFEYWFGPYPFENEKYGHAQFSWGGAMEHQTMTSMTSAYVGTIAHELAHQWYGDAVGPRGWRDLWLNEGFATYSELIWWRGRALDYPGVYDTIRNLYFDRARNAAGTLVLEDTTSVDNMFNGSRVYAKGGVVLDMLEHLVGPEAMRTILRTWADAPARRFGTATTADFENHVESVTGQDFSTFFMQWVTTGSGYPVYAADWWVRPAAAGSYDVTVRLSQRHDAGSTGIDAFEMPVDLVVTTSSGAQRFTVNQTDRVQEYVLSVPDRPTAIAVDPDRKILRGESVIVTGIEPPEGLPTSLRVADLFPVPATDRLHVLVDVADSSSLHLEVFDLLGRRVIRIPIDAAVPGRWHESIATGGLSPGVYVVRLSSDRRSDARTFIVGGR